MRNLLVTLKFDGTNYHGWQIQQNAPTVQEIVTEAVRIITGKKASVHGCSRTDTGVHANMFCFSFKTASSLPCNKIVRALNGNLPFDIAATDCIEVEEDFHARFNATGKVYNYAILLEAKDVFFHDVMYLYPYAFDEELFKDALTHFIGVHNFKNFTSKVEDAEGFVREIFDIETNVNGEFVSVTLHGTGFMRYMIRYIIGCALEVCKGKMTLEEVDELLDDSSERHIVSCKAPANGLTLVRVEY